MPDADSDGPIAVDNRGNNPPSNSSESGGTNWKRVIIIIAVLLTLIVGCTYAQSKLCGLSDEEREERNRKGFHCLDTRDGSHYDVVLEIKERLNDPDSFEHISTSVAPVDSNGEHYLVMKFRANNAFGAKVIGQAEAIVQNDGCDAFVYSIE